MSQIKISKATVICGDGVDKCYIHCNDYITPIWPFKGELTFTFDAAQGTGEEYIRQNFNIEVEVIHTREEIVKSR